MYTKVSASVSFSCLFKQTQPYIKYGGGGLVAKWCPSLAISWAAACQAPLSMGFSRQEYWGGLPFPSPYNFCERMV